MLFLYCFVPCFLPFIYHEYFPVTIMAPLLTTWFLMVELQSDTWDCIFPLWVGLSCSSVSFCNSGYCTLPETSFTLQGADRFTRAALEISMSSAIHKNVMWPVATQSRMKMSVGAMVTSECSSQLWNHQRLVTPRPPKPGTICASLVASAACSSHFQHCFKFTHT